MLLKSIKLLLPITILISLSCSIKKASTSAATDTLKFTNLFSSDWNEDISCYRIPAIVTANNGDLLVAIDERVPSCGDLKWSKEINIVIRRSSDNGESWTDIERVADHPYGQSASDPSMIVDKITGEIILFYNYMDLDKEKDVYYLKMMTSKDNGISWGEPIDITSQISKPSWHNDFKFITSGRGIQTRAGKLIHTMVNLDSGLHLFYSDDHGKSWNLLNTPLLPGNESKIVELDNGSWMVNCRLNGPGMRHIHTSDDQGKTWIDKADPTLVDPGCNASIIRYTSKSAGDDKNRLLFANANSADGRVNLTVKISYDEGQTWSTGKSIYTGGSAYSTMTILDNQDIGLVFEKDDYKENVFTSFSLEWLTNGQDKITPKKSKK